MARTKQLRFTSSEVIKAAYLSGAGAIGRGATATHIYRLLKSHALILAPKTRAQVSFPVRVDRTLFEKIEEVAVQRDSCPKALAGKILEQVAHDSRLLNEQVARGVLKNEDDAFAQIASK